MPGAGGGQCDLKAEGEGDLQGAFGAVVIHGSARTASAQAMAAAGHGDVVEEAVVVGPQGLENGVDAFELRVVQGLFGGLSVGQVDGQHEGGLLAAAGYQAQGAADGLDGVDDAVAGCGEDHGVDGGDVDAFGQDPDVAEHCASVGVLEGGQPAAALVGALCPVDPKGLQVGPLELDGGAGQVLGERFGCVNAVVEDENALQVVVGDGAQDSHLQCGCPQAAVLRIEVGLAGEDGVQLFVADHGHHDLVVGEESAFDRLGHAEAVDDGAEDVAAVHGGGGGAVPQSGGEDAGRGGHVETPPGGDGTVVVDGSPALLGAHARTVGLVHDDEVPGWQLAAVVGLLQSRQGRVGHEHRCGAVLFGDDAGQVCRPLDHASCAPGQAAAGLAH